jgi:Flp pilus assembly protein TadG
MAMRKGRRGRRGVTVVEAAVVLGTFLLFLIGIVEYGRYLFFIHVATNATATAARFAVVHTGDGTTQTQVLQVANDAMAGQQAMLTGYAVEVFAAEPAVTPPTPVAGAQWNDAAFGNGICVRITGNYSFVAGTLIGISSLPVDVSSVMTSEAN